MYTDTVRSTPAPNKPSAFDRWFGAWVLAGTQDREYLRSLPPAQRERTTTALEDLEVVLHSSSERETDAARERLAQTLAVHFWRVIDPEVSWALEERIQFAGGNTADVKLEAMRVGLFLALTEISRVQKVQLGPTRDKVVVDDGILVLCSSDGSVRDSYAGLTHLGKLPRSRSAVRAAILMSNSWLKDAEHAVWAAFVGPTRPLDLRPEHRLHWLARRAIRHAEEWIVEVRLLAQKRGFQDITDLNLEDQSRSPLDALVAAEEHVERLGDVCDVSTPKQRQILDVLHTLFVRGLDIADAKRLAAAELGVQVGAIDTALSRIRTRVRAANRL